MKLINLFFFTLFFIYASIINSKDINFTGLKKLSVQDLNSLVTIDLFKKDYSLDEINTIITDLFNSEIIKDVNLNILEDKYLILIEEAMLINNIYINGNIQIKDNNLINNLISKPNNFINNNNIKKDINFIRQIYTSTGYNNVSVTSTYEKYSDNKVNLIFDIYEGDPNQITKINFIGNNYFSERYLINLISSRELGFLNFFTSGSNFNIEIFNYDQNKIISKYKEKGFFNTNISYKLNEISKSKFELVYYIDENDRLLISKILPDNFDDLKYQEFYSELNKKIINNDSFYDQEIIEKEIDKLNQTLIDKNINSYSYQYSILEEDGEYFLSIFKNPEKQLLINQINIMGNTITHDKVLRSKLYLEPGNYFLDYNKTKSLQKLNRLRYINSVKINDFQDNNKIDLDVIVEENKKTGNLIFAGSFTGDVGFGLTLGLNDYNFIGSGNELNSSFTTNSELINFNINYKQYPINNSNLYNNYFISNTTSDLTDSFGFKSDKIGAGYSIGYDYSDKVNISFGFDYESIRNYSGLNSNSYIQDNIGNFNQFTFNYLLSFDSTNDIFYPTEGTKNNIKFELSPAVISENPYYKLTLINDLYLGNSKNDNFFFLSNRFGLANSLDGNLKTINAYSLGGMNFKGFDYRGIGSRDSSIYLGGNNFYTSTLGYGGKFLFDKSDNINYRTFITSGSIWGSDYATNNSFKNRLSAGISLDIMTAVLPISLSYAIPIQKEDEDKDRRFNFSIGTSF